MLQNRKLQRPDYNKSKAKHSRLPCSKNGYFRAARRLKILIAINLAILILVNLEINSKKQTMYINYQLQHMLYQTVCAVTHWSTVITGPASCLGTQVCQH